VIANGKGEFWQERARIEEKQREDAIVFRMEELAVSVTTYCANSN
jgi:nucleoside phosphorylase